MIEIDAPPPVPRTRVASPSDHASDRIQNSEVCARLRPACQQVEKEILATSSYPVEGGA